MANIVNVQQPQDIDTSEILREYGLEDAEDLGVVIQNNDSTVIIPASSITSVSTNASASDATSITSILEPPSLDLDNDTVLDDIDLTAETNIETNIGISNNGNVADINDNSSITSVDNNIAERLETEEALKYLLPVNTKSVEVDETTSRFSGAAWFNAIQNSSIILAGLGGIGSYVSYILSRMKPRQMFLYDDDIVEKANLSGQLYSTSMVGRKKVNAMANLAKDFSEYNGMLAVPTKFTKETPAGDIMICGFDNMDARKIFFNSWLNHVIKHPHPEKCLYIDGRLDMESFQVFCVTGDDTYNINKYNSEYLFNDWEVNDTVCSMKQTTYCANMIGSVIVNLFTNFISNSLKSDIKRDLPFKVYYDASMMYFKTES